MTRPTIGVTGAAHKGRIMWLCSAFLVWIFGGRPVRITAKRNSPPPLDGLIIGGGDDISAHLYGGELVPEIRIDKDRDTLELDLLQNTAADKTPTLGICRGSQMMNISRGGTLHGDIYKVYPKAKRIRTTLPRKRVTLDEGSRLQQILGAKRTLVNALHHQSVNTLGENLSANAHDGQSIIQGIEDKTHPFFIGVQWHPEFMPFHPRQWRLFRQLIKAAKKQT